MCFFEDVPCQFFQLAGLLTGRDPGRADVQVSAKELSRPTGRNSLTSITKVPHATVTRGIKR
jgi:hypothetical protein